MATSYSANQYDNAFVSKHLQSWEVPKTTSARPKPRFSASKPIATIDGRLLISYDRKNASKTNYINTWDLPKHLPGSNIDNPTARDRQAYEQLHKEFSEMKFTLTGKEFNYRPVKSKNKRSQICNDSANVTSCKTGQSEMDRDAHQPILSNGRNSSVGNEENIAGRSEKMGANAAPQISNKIPVPDFSLEERGEEKISAL